MTSSNNPYSTPSSDVEEASININIPFFKSWLVFALIATIGGFAAGFAAGGVVGAIMGASGLSIPSIQAVARIAGFIVGLPISYLTFKWSVNKYIVSKIIKTSYV